jgi:hypothetical protein
MLIDVDPIAPVPNVGSQLERAVIAYLKACFQKAALPGLTLGEVNFYFSNDWRARVVPLLDVLAHKSTEQPPHTRSESYSVKIEVEWPGANQPGATNTEMNWIQINNFIGLVMAALSQTDSATDVSAGARVTSELITRAGRALAVDGSSGSDPDQVADAANNADMAEFTCDFVEFKGSQRAERLGDGTVWIKEVRNFEMRACPSNID